MSYHPPRKSALVAPVSQRVAVVLAAWLPDDQVFRRTATMPEDLRAEVLATIDAIKAAALAHKQAFAEVGNRPAAITPEAEESEVKGTPPDLDPAGVGLLRSDAAGALLGLSARRVRQLVSSGELEAEKVGSEWIITRTAVDDYLATRKAA
ncbi:helix-turn-helix domain-containing protein [Brevibacterium casei]|uniref:Helix-turn-helix domain-containing protein n=1 Tax=Brevibacterium casei TaxID=33889 RepID=A0A7T2THM3_9MICO|nr:helix-turn-helix domain-containing protein [Brevibacterium casei]QPS33996.1 helix-turn-helix domain-containing protein [Brevibacterium casei]